MKTLAAKDAKNGFGRLLDTARAEPVTIEKHGRPVAVVVSFEEYERLEAFEDAYWTRRADEAEAEGYIGNEESGKLIEDLMGA